MCKVVSEMLTLNGQWEMEWWAKDIVQNGGKAPVKPKNQPGAGFFMAEMKQNPLCKHLHF